MHISGPPAAGTSEVLRKVYDRLFHEQRFVVPFYFALRPGDISARSAASRYAYQFLLQAIAFRRNDPDLILASPDISELVKLAPMSDAEWVEPISEICRNDRPLNDERPFIRSAIAAPVRASTRGQMRVCVIVDDLHASTALDGGHIFIDELFSFSATPRTPMLAGSRRTFGLPDNNFERLLIGALNREECAILIEILAADQGITIGEQARDLIAVESGGDLSLIRSFLHAAHERGVTLDSYREVEQLYVDELFNGRIGRSFDEIFMRAAPDHRRRKELIEILFSAVGPELNRFTIEAFRDRLGITGSEFNALTESLVLDEIISIESGQARLMTSNLIQDYLESRHRSARRDTTASAAAYSVTNALKTGAACHEPSLSK
jgi:hypothetical protein